MKAFIKENKILLTAMALMLIVCFVVIGTRFLVESHNKTYDIVLDYNEIAALAIQTDHDVSWWLEQFNNMGITKVGLMEESLMTLMEDKDIHLTGTVMDVLTKDASWQSGYPPQLTALLGERGYGPFDIMVEMEGKETVDFVLDAIEKRFRPDRFFQLNLGDKAYVLIKGTPDMTLYSQQYKYMNSKAGGFVERMDIEASKIMYISLGLLPDKVKAIQELGMDVIPRTLSYNGWNDTKYGQAVIDGYAKYGIVPQYIIVGGEAVIGFDDGTSLAKNYILNNGITIGLIEDTTQRENIMQYGVNEVAIDSGYDTVRVFSVWNYIQYRYQYYGYEGAEEIENTFFRAVTERNIRVIYFKPILHQKDLHTYMTNVSEYEKMFGNLEKRLEKHGIHFASASAMADYRVPTIFKVLLGIGVVLGAVLLLRSFVKVSKKISLILAALGSVCVLAAFYVMPNTAELIASLAAAIVFGCLAVTFYTAQSKHLSDVLSKDASVLKIVKSSILILVVSVLISFVGGMMTAAPISSINYMLEINIFRGVKVGQLLPAAYFVIAYLAYFGYGGRERTRGNLQFQDVTDLMNTGIKVWMLFLAAIVGGVGVYYILRTGHDSTLEVSSYEMLFRNELEKVLIARPRSKEFLFAFPAIMLMVYSSVRRLRLWPVLFGLGGAIGMTSVINTFEHIRTPLYLGFIRTGYSLVFGILVGILAILIFEGLYRIYLYYVRKYAAAHGVKANG